MTRLGRGERVTPEIAGWRYLSFEVHELSAPMPLGAPGVETAVIGLAGGAFRVGELELPGRASVWDGLPSAVYLPPGIVATLEPDGPVTVAVAQAPASGRETAGAPVRIGPEDVTVEVRGAGNATRQINHIITPDFPADRLEVVEVLTPSGNWSSWPPHKHDTDDMPREAILEEVYHYRFRRPEAWGVQRLYGGSVEGLWAVARRRDRDRSRRVPPVRRHARRRRLLPQRAGRRHPDDGLLVRPGARPRPRGVGADGARSEGAAGRARLGTRLEPPSWWPSEPPSRAWSLVDTTGARACPRRVDAESKCTRHASSRVAEHRLGRDLVADERLNRASDTLNDAVGTAVLCAILGPEQVALDLEALPIQDLPLLVRHDQARKPPVEVLQAADRGSAGAGIGRIGPRRSRSSSSIFCASSATVR